MRMSSVDTLSALCEQGERGLHWYSHAKSQILEASSILSVEPQRLADLLALFSPRVSVKRNIHFAVHYVRTNTHTHDVMRSTRIAVAHYEETGIIRGPKTSAFSRAIMGDPDAVVLDVWMARALRIPQTAFDRKPVHAKATERIAKTASRLSVSPAQAQAAIWTATVSNAGRNPPQFTLVHNTLFGKEIK